MNFAYRRTLENLRQRVEHALLHHARRTFERHVLARRLLAERPHMRHVRREPESRVAEGPGEGVLGVSYSSSLRFCADQSE